MKKILCAAFMLGTVCFVAAQEPVVSTTTRVDYSTQVPLVIRSEFQTTNPAVTQVTWMPMGTEWWYASYTTNENRINRVFYNTQPWYMEPGRDVEFKVALPVLNTFVPEDVITAAIKAHGNDLFSITAKKPEADGSQSYYVTLIKNGVSEIIEMGADGMAMSTSRPVHVQEQKPF